MREYDKLHQLENAFIVYEIATHGVNPRETLEVVTLRIKNREGYKQGVFDKYHIVPVSEIGEEYIVDLIKDLIPVCSNCHMILHAGKGISVENLKKKLKK